MKRKSLSLTLLSLLLIAELVPMASSHRGKPGEDYPTDPFTLVKDTISDIETLDPAWGYDTRSNEVILQVYETLVFFAVNRKLGPLKAGQTSQFVDQLATDLNITDINEVSPEGLPWVQRYIFRIRGLSGMHTVERSAGIPSANPVGTDWNEVLPWRGTDWRLEEWEDTDSSGALSPKDQVKMSRDAQNVNAPYWRVYQYFLVEGFDYVHNRMHIIEKPVLFHVDMDGDGNLDALTTADVEYSFERALVQDRDGGPMWTLYKPLINVYGALDPSTEPNFGLMIDHAIQSNATHVWFNLAMAYPEWETLLQILSQTWSSVVNKEWAISEGDLDIGSVPSGWSNWQQIWNTWHNPPVSFLDDAVNNPNGPIPPPTLRDGGTGPYQVDYWIAGTTWSVVWFPEYWDHWPAQVGWPTHPNPLPNGETRLGGFIKRVIWNKLVSWTTRRTRFLVGDSDETYVPRPNMGQVLNQPHIRCYFPLNASKLDAFFFTFDIATTSPYGGVLQPSGIFDESGIPTNIFSDINVRRGFAHAFDYNYYLSTAYLGEGKQPATPVISGLKYCNALQAKYSYDLIKTEYYLKLAWGGVDVRSGGPGQPVIPEDPTQVIPGALWINGMTFMVIYNTGNVVREIAAQMIANTINLLNPKFHLSPFGVQWDSVFLSQMRMSEFPLFVSGWTADFIPDPHDFVFPFMYSSGTFAAAQRYSNPSVDSLIEQGIQTTDGPGRELIYDTLQSMYYDDVPSVPIVQPIGRHWERDWMKGWYYNPLYGGSLASAIDSTAPEAQVEYVYHLWKAKTHKGDANNDGSVDIIDVSLISASWTGPPTGPLHFDPRADISGSEIGIPDGTVDMLDAALISAYWDGPPEGPSHPQDP